jgi:phage terminase small subunit
VIPTFQPKDSRIFIDRVAMQKLTPRQKAFAEYYAASGNAVDSARKAGYRHPCPQGTQNLSIPKIAAYVAELTAPGQDSRIADAKARQEFWTSVMLDPEAAMRDRLKASELLGRCQGDFIERLKISGDAEAPLSITVQFVDPE